MSWNEAPRSSLLRRSSHFGSEGRKLLGITELKPSEMPEIFGGASASAAGHRAFVVTVFEQVESRWCR